MKKLLIISLVFLLGIPAVIGFLVYPLLAGIEENAREVSLLSQELATFQSQTESFLPLKAEYEKSEPYLNKIETLFIDSSAPLELIEFLEKSADLSDISIEISPGSYLKKDNPWPSMGFQLALSGSFAKCLQFIKRTESSPYLIDIQDLIIRKVSEEERKTDKNIPAQATKVNLTIKVFAK